MISTSTSRTASAAAVVASIRRILSPSSIAVDRRQPYTGHDRLRTRAQPRPRRVHRRRAAGQPTRRIGRRESTRTRRVGDAPIPPDLAIIAVPAGAVAGVVAECGAAHVGGIVIISAGFAELGTDGRAVEASLVKSARRYGMRIVGPNCMGLANTDPAIRMNATFAPVDPIPGNVAFMTQSGRPGHLVDRRERATRHRHLELRVGRQQGRHLRQRPAAILGER